jgi:protein-disulfide isomerase
MKPLKRMIRDMNMLLSRRALLTTTGIGAVSMLLAACNDKAATKAEAPAAPSKETTAAVVKPADAATPAAPVKAAAAAPLKQSEGMADLASLMKTGPLKDISIGKEDAKITIVEYASMTCPHCRHFHETTLPDLTKNYLDTGKARLILREFPFDPRATAAFMLARCAGDDKYYPMVSVLFQQQEVWATADDAQAALLQIARLAGFSEESFKACLTNQKLLNDVNAVRERATKEFGVESTPTFFINGKKYTGAMSFEEMSAILDSML